MQIEKERIRIAKFKLWIILASKYARKKVCLSEGKKACSNWSVQCCVVSKEVWVVKSSRRTIMLFYGHFLVLIWGLLDIELMPCPFIRHVKCATFRRFCNDGNKSKQWGLFYAGLGEGDYGIICHFPFLNHLSALRYHLGMSGKKQGAVILYSSGSYCYL